MPVPSDTSGRLIPTIEVGDTQWLHGVRGIAAILVVFIHFIEGQFNTGFRGYLAEPHQENRYFLQLPPFRIIFAGQGMVIIFFVISAYSISMRPLMLREIAPREQFLQSLSSATFRRGMRLYIPTFTIEAISHIAMIIGLYHWPEHEASLTLSIPEHAAAFLRYILDAIYSLRLRKLNPLNGQLWTIPLEFLGSNMVFLMILGTSNLRPIMRPVAAALVALLGFWNLDWILFTFMSGLTISEIHTYLDNHQETFHLGREGNKERKQGMRHRRPSELLGIINMSLLLIGVYLLCLPEQPHQDPFSKEYRFLLLLWGRGSNETGRIATIWKSLGGAFLIFAISNSPQLQSPFRTRLSQFLGKISFGVYLVHILIYQMWKHPVSEFLKQVSVFGPRISLWFSYGGTFLFLLWIIVWTGVKVTQLVDQKAIKFAKWIEAKL